MRSRTVVAFLIAATLGACAHSLIAGTQVRDTPRNREILDVVHQAVDALARRDVPAVMALISPRYFEDNGTPTPADDYGYQQLRDHLLADTLSQTREMFIDMQVQDLTVQGGEAQVYVRYDERYRIETPSGPQWQTKRDFDRISLDREDGAWKITSGL